MDKERQKRGITRRKAAGLPYGRPKGRTKADKDDVIQAWQLATKTLDRWQAIDVVTERFSISRKTLERYIGGSARPTKNSREKIAEVVTVYRNLSGRYWQNKEPLVAPGYLRRVLADHYGIGANTIAGWCRRYPTASIEVKIPEAWYRWHECFQRGLPEQACLRLFKETTF